MKRKAKPRITHYSVDVQTLALELERSSNFVEASFMVKTKESDVVAAEDFRWTGRLASTSSKGAGHTRRVSALGGRATRHGMPMPVDEARLCGMQPAGRLH
jgi:hypothetical protein